MTSARPRATRPDRGGRTRFQPLHRRPPAAALACVALMAASAFAAPQQPQRTPQQYAQLLEGAERVARMQVPRVIEALGLREGAHIADLGSGSGLFTRPMAQAVGPRGVVYAVDIDQGLLDIVATRAREAGIRNIRPILAATDDARLPEPVEVVFVCDTLHHIGNQAAYLKGLVRYLTPGGRIAVIDFAEQWPEGHESMRYSRSDLAGWMAGAGLVEAASHDFLENAFFVIYRRR